MISYQTFLGLYFKKLNLSYTFETVKGIDEYLQVFTFNNKKVLALYIDLVITYFKPIMFTSVFIDAKPDKNIYYLPLFKDLSYYEEENSFIKSTFLLHSYTNLFLQQDCYKFIQFFNTFEKFLAIPVIRYNDWLPLQKIKKEKYADFKVRNYEFEITPAIELFSISKHDFNSHLEVIESIKTSLLNTKSKILINTPDFNFEQSDLYKELLNYCSITKLDICDNFYELSRLNSFEKLIDLDPNKIATYIKSIFDGSVDLSIYKDFTTFITYFKGE